jgi:hypothetical protein
LDFNYYYKGDILIPIYVQDPEVTGSPVVFFPFLYTYVSYEQIIYQLLTNDGLNLQDTNELNLTASNF